MRTRTLVLWLVLASAVGTVQQASAQLVGEEAWQDDAYSSPFSREGIYVGAGALYAMENFDRDSALKDPASGLDIGGQDTGGPQVRFGYRFHPRFAGEVLFQHYADFEVSRKTNASPSEKNSFSAWSLTINAKAYALLDRVQPYAVLGIGGLVFEDDPVKDSDFMARLGGGVDFYLTDNIVIDAEIAYVFPADKLDNFQFVTFALGAQYRY